MALDATLREIANSAAGVYSLVIDRTQRSAVPVQTTLRLIPINVPKGPVNALVYINKADYAGFESVFGQIKARDERKGNFSIRTVRHALENGPVVVMNLRKFDDEKDRAGILGGSSKCTDVNELITDAPFKSLHNTDRLWFPDHNRLQDIAALEDNLVSFANVGSKKISFFVRKSEISGWDMTIREYFASKNQEAPEYLNQNDLMKDTFLDVYIFETDFADNLVNMTNENYGYLFTENGLKAVYTENGVEYDGLAQLSQIADAKFMKRYQGSLIPGLTDISNNVMDLIQLINADTVNTGLMMHFNEDLADSNYSDWEPAYDEDDNIMYENDGNKRPFAVDFVGHGRFHTDGQGLIEIPKEDTDYKQWMSHDPLSAKHVKATCVVETVEATPKVPGKNVVQTLTVTKGGKSGVSSAFTLKINGKDYRVEVTSDQLANEIANSIGMLQNTGYNITVSEAIVTFTAEAVGVRPAIEFTDIDSEVTVEIERTTIGSETVPATPKHSVVKVDSDADFDANDLNETVEFTAFVKNNALGVTECYVIASHTGFFTGDYIIAKSSNIGRINSGKSIGSIMDEQGIDYNVISLEASELIATSTILDTTPGTETLILSDGTEITGLKKTTVYKYNNIYEASEKSPLKAMSLKSYTPRYTSIKDGVGQFCDGTSSTQKDILNMLNNPHIVEGFKALKEYKFRYVVDAFKSYIEPNCKAEFATFAGTLNVRVIANMPFMEDFAKCKNPYFKDTPTSSFDPKYIAKGGNNKLVSSNSFSLPVDNADKIWFFGPGMLNNSTGREITVPPAGAVSKAFLNKFLAGNLYPYSAVANDTGILNCDGMVGFEYDITDTERNSLEPFGYNSIVYIENQGYCVFGNQTAQQKIKSDLSKIHISELVFTIQEEMRNILKGYVFKANNYANRLAIWTKAEAVMTQILKNGGVYYYRNIIDGSNNTEEVIENDMGILDTVIVASHLGEKWVHRTYLEKGGNIAGFDITTA